MRKGLGKSWGRSGSFAVRLDERPSDLLLRLAVVAIVGYSQPLPAAATDSWCRIVLKIVVPENASGSFV